MSPMAPPGEESQEFRDILLCDKKATVAFLGAEHCIGQWKLEKAKIESDALGPQSPEEQHACVEGWAHLEKALSIYRQGAAFLEDSQKKIKATIKNMELEIQSQPESDQQQLLECIRQVKHFKKAQKEKLGKTEEQIQRIQSQFDEVFTMLKQVAKDQGTTCEKLMAEKIQALGFSASSEEAKEAMKEFGGMDTDSKSGGYQAEPQPEAPSEPQPEAASEPQPEAASNSGGKKNKKKGK